MKLIKYLIVILFSIISILIMHKTNKILKDSDSIMLDIKKNKELYSKKVTEAIIKNNTIIPGKNGLEVNVNSSYNKMKAFGCFRDNLIVYNIKKPRNQLSNNMDKYIISSNTNYSVGIFLYIDDNMNLDIFLNYNTKLNFIINYNYYLTNLNIINKLKERGHIFLIEDNKKDNIKKFKNANRDNLYCFNSNMESDYLNTCYQNGFYSVSSSIYKRDYLLNVKHNLVSGMFIVLKGKYENELNNIINYIISKGYKIEVLPSLIDENK